MTDNPIPSIQECFGDISDPRVQGRCLYPLLELLTIAICAVIAGAETWVEIEVFGNSKKAWLTQFLELKHGIPSHDTFGNVFAMLDAQAFQRSFVRWVQGVFSISKGQVVSIDGKTARRSHDKASGTSALHLVSAWASVNGLTLGQRKVADKSNEISAIPELLELLRVKGCIVTIDAIGCQKEIAKTIRDKQADYVLAVKGNQKQLHQDLEHWFAHADQIGFEGLDHDHCQTINKSHGRIELRKCWTITDPLAFEYIRHYEGWAGIKAIVRVQRERRLPDRVEQKTAYYISSLAASAETLLNATRQHWGIENSLHWVMDVTFQEDQMRTRKGDSAQNLIALRNIALNILKKDRSKGSLRQKRYRAALDDAFLRKLLSQI